jgi:hypothetical protein
MADFPIPTFTQAGIEVSDWFLALSKKVCKNRESFVFGKTNVGVEGIILRRFLAAPKAAKNLRKIKVNPS